MTQTTQPRALGRVAPSDIAIWLALATAWSSSFAVIKIGLGTLDPMVLVAGRMLIAMVVIIGIALALGYRPSRRVSDWGLYTVTGLLGSAVPFLLITYAERDVDSALAAILMGLGPVVTATLAGLLLPDERITGRVVLGLAGAFAGIVLLAGPSVLAGLGAQVGGQAAILAATFCYSANTVFVRIKVRRPPMEMAAGSSIAGTLVVLMLVLVTGADLSGIEPTAASLGAIVYLGLISTAAANLALFYLIPRIGAMRMSQVNFAVPVGGTILGALILQEPLTPLRIAALGLIVGSVWLTTTARRQ